MTRRNSKNVLAIETSTSRGSIALLSGGKLLGAPCIGERFEHSQTLLPQLQQLLKSHDLRPSDLDLICVSRGPGSFTGLRVGIAAAKGLAMGLGIPVIGVSTFEVLLAGYLHSLAPSLPPSRIQLLLDAKRGEFFAQLWRCSGTSQAPKIVLESNIASVVAPKTILVSPQLSKVRSLLSGSAALFDTKDRFPDAADLAILGLQKFLHQKKGDEDLKPVYLRKTDAEILFKNRPNSVFRWERGSKN